MYRLIRGIQINMNKFNKLYNTILKEQTEDELDKIITFVSTNNGEYYQNHLIQYFENTLLNFKKQFTEFKNVKLAYDIDENEYIDVYAEILPEDLNTIRINLFSFLQMCYYGQFNKQFSFKEMINQIDNGTYEDMYGPLIAHELAHIADIRKNGISNTNVHGKTFKQELMRLI